MKRDRRSLFSTSTLVLAAAGLGLGASLPLPASSQTFRQAGAGVPNPAADAPTTSPDPDLEIRHEVHYYPVEGATASALRAGLAASGPKDRRTGRRYAGLTEYRLAWRFSYAVVNENCAITNVTATLALTQLYPHWAPGPRTSKRLHRKWQRYMTALTRHEDDHARTAVRGGLGLLHAIRALEPRSSCEELAASARQEFSRAIAGTNIELSLADAFTGHGRSDGVRLP
ncbi:MAG: DUF922 domain-containing protein [Elusimicrobiota bacterium]|jgi:predicted secreted Zn-dependent protease